ncbi:urease accessory protein UreF [Streptacidiphilus neutrinimicus]|uniref:urease accessory protein UreF n=1 Tax=Streptacidiphilus neutrinimicus TaxID=105420 RepID=UPI0005A9A37A|nr:urease accessory UreF family protein [Streptacidiphilus neutrinimicus]
MTDLSTSPALLLLADGRFPAGGHAHSGGVEAAVRAGRVGDAASLREFCAGRLHTVGLTSAALAAAAATGTDPSALDEAAEARTPSPALRAASRRLGRQLLRAARAAWPDPALDKLARALPGGTHQPVAFGLVATAAGLRPADAATAMAYDTVSGPVTACVRLLGLDPFQAMAVLSGLTAAIAAVAHEAAAAAALGDLDLLPSLAAPLLEISAEHHASWPVRLFAS